MDSRVHSTPSEVAAVQGVVIVDGPDGVAVTLTPEAAEETGERLINGSAEATGPEDRRDHPQAALIAPVVGPVRINLCGGGPPAGSPSSTHASLLFSPPQ